LRTLSEKTGNKEERSYHSEKEQTTKNN